MEQINEATKHHGGARLAEYRRSKKPLVVLLLLLALLVGAYLALCAYADSLNIFYPNYKINGVDVGGLTTAQAREKLDTELPGQTVILSKGADSGSAEDSSSESVLSLTLGELGFSPEVVNASCVTPYENWVKESMMHLTSEPFFTKGWCYLQYRLGNRTGTHYDYTLQGDAFEAAVDDIKAQLSLPALDASYTMGEGSISITKARDGYFVVRQALEETLSQADEPYLQEYHVDLVTDASVSLTARQIYNEIGGEMQNAGYDKETASITPERIGVAFDVAAAQAALDIARPGETVTVSARIDHPTITAEILAERLFRDVLGEARTHVSGTAARINNVKLSAATIHEFVLNPGETFSYNESVGERTAEAGYQPAPAYIRGETVDEIGGGICQTSSTLYLACLRGDLEITERYAHRYVPAYIAKGMDATVSWGGPDYKFTNNTGYPIKITTQYEKNYLTIRVIGTNIDGRYAKVTFEQLSSTPWETVYEEDPLILSGTEQIKTTPYTGYLVKTYHTIYDAEGKVLDSHYEATSDYKVRNQVILGPPENSHPIRLPLSPTAKFLQMLPQKFRRSRRKTPPPQRPPLSRNRSRTQRMFLLPIPLIRPVLFNHILCIKTHFLLPALFLRLHACPVFAGTRIFQC